jgi:hypothetical protein
MPQRATTQAACSHRDDVAHSAILCKSLTIFTCIALYACLDADHMFFIGLKWKIFLFHCPYMVVDGHSSQDVEAMQRQREQCELESEERGPMVFYMYEKKH